MLLNEPSNMKVVIFNVVFKHKSATNNSKTVLSLSVIYQQWSLKLETNGFTVTNLLKVKIK